MSVQNLNTFGETNLHPFSLLSMANSPADPFADEGDPLGDSQDVGSTADYIHIRIQQRNGRKTLTTLQGVPKGEYPVFSIASTRLTQVIMGTQNTMLRRS